MNVRQDYIKVAKQTVDILKKKQYVSFMGNQVDITDSLTQAVDQTILYQQPLPLKQFDLATFPVIEVNNETTTQAAIRLQSQGKTDIAVLNFASARNPGGGFLAGATAQEEDLCRVSGLYACLLKKPVYYNENNLCETSYYTDNVIYSPNVPFIRNDQMMLLDYPYYISVITAPAPNISGMKNIDQKFLKSTLLNRATKILQIAEAHGHKNLVLGAWGAGVFGNDPIMIAQTFKKAMKAVPAFEHVCFGVYDTRTPPHVFEAFKQVFEENK